jgi:hypothetical protein
MEARIGFPPFIPPCANIYNLLWIGDEVTVELIVKLEGCRGR